MCPPFWLTKSSALCWDWLPCMKPRKDEWDYLLGTCIHVKWEQKLHLFFGIMWITTKLPQLLDLGRRMGMIPTWLQQFSAFNLSKIRAQIDIWRLHVLQAAADASCGMVNTLKKQMRDSGTPIPSPSPFATTLSAPTLFESDLSVEWDFRRTESLWCQTFFCSSPPIHSADCAPLKC